MDASTNNACDHIAGRRKINIEENRAAEIPWNWVLALAFPNLF
jgi:hypothetical protein